jgi:hypothetical protein
VQILLTFNMLKYIYNIYGSHEMVMSTAVECGAV